MGKICAKHGITRIFSFIDLLVVLLFYHSLAVYHWDSLLSYAFHFSSVGLKMQARLSSRNKFLSDQIFQTKIISDQTFQVEINPDQIFQTQVTSSEQTFQTQRVCDQTFQTEGVLIRLSSDHCPDSKKVCSDKKFDSGTQPCLHL